MMHVTPAGRARRARWFAAISLLALGAGTEMPYAQSDERYTLSGSSLAVYDLVGQVTVEPASGNDVEVIVTRGGPDAPQLRVERGPIEGVSTLRVVFPSPRVVYRRPPGSWGDRMQVGEDGRFN